MEDIENVGAGAVADHGARACGIADVTGEELAGHGDIHFGKDVVVGGGFVDDAVDERVGVGGTAQIAQCFGERDVDEDELLALVPIFEDGGIVVGAAHAAIAAGDDVEEFHALDGIGDESGIGDEAEVEDGEQRAVDVVLDAVFESAVEVAIADEGSVETFLEEADFCNKVGVGCGVAARCAMSAKLRKPMMAMAVEKAKCSLSFWCSSQMDVSGVTMRPDA